jgi:hypothetical protein
MAAHVARAVAIVILGQCAPALSADSLPVPFAIDTTRSDLDRPVRPFAQLYEGPLVDTHAHLDEPRSGFGRSAGISSDDIPAAIAAAKVDRIVVMPTPNSGRRGHHDANERTQWFGKTSAGRVLALCGSDYLTPWMNNAAGRGNIPSDVDAVMAELAQDLKSGGCAGVGEIGFKHFNKTGMQAVVQLPAGYPPLLAVAATAAQAGVVLDMHAEPVEPEGASHESEVFGTIALMYRQSPNLRLIASHTAMTNPANARALLMAFPALMMNVKRIGSSVDWDNLEPVNDERGRLYTDWAALFEDMPDRFMIGTDFKFGRQGDHSADAYTQRIHEIRLMLGSLDPAAARKIGVENAERIFGPLPH